MTEVVDYLEGFSSIDWTVNCGRLGRVKDGVIPPGYYCSVIPGHWGGRIWEKGEDGKSYREILPAIIGQGLTLEAACADCTVKLMASPEYSMYKALSVAFMENLNARLGDRERTANGEAGEDTRVDGL